VKGVELPINILVIVAIAVIVLLGLIALYFVGWGPFAGAAGLEGVKNAACRELVQGTNCAGDSWAITISNFDADDDGSNDPGTGWNWAVDAEKECGDTAVGATEEDNLASLAACYYGRTNEAGVKGLCNCPTV
jgi:hypothetical protein